MFLAQPSPPLLNCSSHEACLRLRNNIVRSFDNHGYEFVDFCPPLEGLLIGNRQEICRYKRMAAMGRSC